MRRRRRRGGQIGETFAELTTPALRATPPLRGGEYFTLRIHDSELVNPSAAVLGDIDIVLGIHGDAVRLVELSRVVSRPAKAR